MLRSDLLTQLTDSDEPYLTTRDIARKLKVKERTIQDWTRRYSDFPALLLPGSIRIRLSAFVSWLEQFQKDNPESVTEEQK